MKSTQTTSTQLTSPDEEALSELKQGIRAGVHWYEALLKTLGKWQASEETIEGRCYRYFIEGEAFDWMLLSERLLESLDRLVPEDESTAFLLHDILPLDIKPEHMREYLGAKRYKQYLNFYYGVTVERALVMAVQNEIRKERTVAGYVKEQDNTDEAFRRIYGDTEAEMLSQFRRIYRHRATKSINLTEYKEFTYWLFKYRMNHSDRARVASDTKKAINWLNRNRASHAATRVKSKTIIDA
ncbi:MAG TPA: hypothetical protein VEH58_00880, partial [Dehalococcoidales bacterium]|nr:hypothetical protein [Dehalococcoidales bacterium]